MNQFFSLVYKKINTNYSNPKTVLILSLFFLALLIYICSTYTFIGRGDYANYSSVARNLVQGKGFTNDYIAFHFINYPQVSHPEDMWPILQPVWIAISFFFLGINPFSARVPNAVFLTVLALVTYFLGKKLYNPRIGFWAAVLTALNINLLMYSTTWITSDVALAVFSVLIFYLGYQILIEGQKRRVSLIKVFWVGLLSGLAILQKPMGILLPGIYFIFLFYFYRRNLYSFLKPGIILIIGTLIFAGPFFVRNLILFRSLFLPDEHYLGYLVKYFPYESIFSIYYGHVPDIKTWLDYGLAKFIKVNFAYFRYSIDTFLFKDLLMPYTVIVLSFIGLRNIKSDKKLFYLPIIILFVVMSVLMGTYWHYESRYYAMLIPIFNLLATVAFFELFPKINWKNSFIVLAILFITFLPSFKSLIQGISSKETDPSLTAYNWIKNNTPKDAVVLTLAPWEMNFHSERKTVMIPNENKNTILWMAKKYQADYLELEFLQEIKRESLKDQYKGIETVDFKSIYQDPKNVYIYKINWPKVDLDPKTKPDWY